MFMLFRAVGFDLQDLKTKVLTAVATKFRSISDKRVWSWTLAQCRIFVRCIRLSIFNHRLLTARQVHNARIEQRLSNQLHMPCAVQGGRGGRLPGIANAADVAERDAQATLEKFSLFRCMQERSFLYHYTANEAFAVACAYTHTDIN